jgi:plastocyanin
MPEGHRFSPSTLEVAVGEEITFENDGSESHTVTAVEESLPEGADYFASGGASTEEEARNAVEDGLISNGDTFTLTLNEPGTYRYFCIPHESQGMTGTIVVSDE